MFLVLACGFNRHLEITTPVHAQTPEPQAIGECWMEADGTIHMFLRAETETKGGTIVGHSFQAYRPGDPDYAKILEHVGPMRPGDRKPVRAWPD